MKLSANVLKWIAMLTMLADHTGLCLIQYLLLYKGKELGICPFFQVPWQSVLAFAGAGLRVVGRISFPLYCFLLTEGFLHTRSRKKYCLRLTVFAFISQIPFSLAVSNVWAGQGLNVYFELAAGILMLGGLQAAEGFADARRGACMVLAIGSAGAVSELCGMDYGMEGMFIIAAYYLLRDDKGKRAMAGGLISMVGSLEGQYGAGLLSALPAALYDGEKGRQWNKYIFYCFYPLHLLVLFLIRRFLLGIPFRVTLFS